MTDYNLSSKSAIRANQQAFLIQKAKEHLGTAASDAEVQAFVMATCQRYLANLGKPLFQERRAERHQVPFAEETRDNMEEIIADLQILTQEHNTASHFLMDSFNRIHSEKKRLISRISGLSSLVGDLNLIANEQDLNTIYFKESFETANAMDTGYVLESLARAQVSSNEGILTLGRTGTVNLSEAAKVSAVQGNGTAGVGHLAKKRDETAADGSILQAWHYLNEADAGMNADASVLLDNQPDTIFEYQRVNVTAAFKKDLNHYDFGWAESREVDDNLRLRLVIELPEAQIVNWLNLNPYYPKNSSNKIRVHAIRTSVDGFDYVGLYDNTSEGLLNTEINSTPQGYRVADLFDGSNDYAGAAYTGQGVWSFPQRLARFVEIVLDQTDSYPEILGQTVYWSRTENQNYWTQVPAVAELKKENPGEYRRTVDGAVVIYKKEIQADTNGWRYCIGLRDINLMRYQFAPKSVFISQRYHCEQEIDKVMLYANEKIPPAYLTTIAKSNDWIQYYVSFDDVNWIRISPMHQEPVTDAFAPKILELNNNEVDLAAAFQVHKTLLTTDEPVHDVRVKIVLQRPEEDGFEDTTPIVEDIALRLEKKEEDE